MLLTLQKLALQLKVQKSTNLSTKKGFIQSIVYIIDALKVPLSPHLRQQHIDYFSELKILSNDEVNERKADPEYDVIPYNEYLRRIRITFGNDSKEYLMSMLYNEVTARDNFGELFIANTPQQISPNKNYLLVPRKGLLTIILQKYKTSKRYGKVVVPLSNELLQLFRNYLGDNVVAGQRVFPEYNNGLTDFIGKMNRKIGIPSGSINYIRQSKISEIMSIIHRISPAEKVKLANNMLHSPVAQLKYVRGLKN